MPYSASSSAALRSILLRTASAIGVASCLTPSLAQAQDNPAAFEITQAGSPAQLQDPFEIEARADKLAVEPVISVAMIGSVSTAVRGDTVEFLSYANYPAFIDHAEVRIFANSTSADAAPLAVLPVDGNGLASWHAPGDGPEALLFVYRAYAANGHFDETKAHELTLLNRQVKSDGDASHPAFGRTDEAAKRTIDLHGISVTITGKANPQTDVIRVSGQLVPVDDDGRFVARQIVPRDATGIDVGIRRGGKTVVTAHRAFAPANGEWFVVGQGDLTLGTSSTSGPTTAVSGDPLVQGDYLAGRAAFYAKGVVDDDIKVTAALDTGEALVKDLFSNLDRKDPRQLLRRLGSDQYYPTYGDDSTLTQDAPTQGRFYVRVQKQQNQLVIGNFTTALTGTDLAQLDRGLFGALIDLNSPEITSFGERKTQITAFASDPGTTPGRDEFRGTGGSLYFLKHQDLSVGSERVRVEVRDQTTGLVLEAHELHAQEDYDFDPFQGRITLLRPLASISAGTETVRDGSASGQVPVLVVRYEYTPATTQLSGYTLGGRASKWFGEHLRLGATAQRDTSQGADQTLFGSDLLLRYAAGTYVKAELARTDGPGAGQSNSVNGGLNFADFASPGLQSREARAWRTELAIDLAEIRNVSGDAGKIGGFYEHSDAGFSSVGHLTQSDTVRWGANVSLPLGATTGLAAKVDQITTSAAGRNRTATLDLKQAIGSAMVAKLGIRNEQRAVGLLHNSTQSGQRTDAALQLGYEPRGKNFSVYGFGQLTLDHDASRASNNRIGIGAKTQMDSRTSFSGEVSQGDGGMGADLQINRHLGDGSEAYVGYALFADRTDTALEPQNIFTRSNRGTLTVGARKRLSDALSVNSEQRMGLGGDTPSLVRSFGLKFDPTAHLSITGSFETGRIDDAITGPFKRTAGTLGLGYTADHIRLGSSVEARFEQSSDREQRVWLFRNSADYSVNPDWRALARLNFAVAGGDQTQVRDADFVEGVVGLAYRPVGNERLNALVRFTYFQDMGPVGQTSGTGTTQNPKQISRIVSIDANYDLTERLTIGAKYGFRSGSVSLDRNSNVFVSSTAHLGVARLDFRVARHWDILAEGRVLAVPTAQDYRIGGLAAVYRHINQNVKIGLGYSLSEFSDDLTDQSYSSRGVFLNLVSKF